MIANINQSLLKLVSFEILTNGVKSIGALVDNDRFVVDFCNANKSIPNDMRTFIDGGNKMLSIAVDIISSGKNRINIENVNLRAPILNPEKVIGIGLNYKEHALEANMPFPKEPVMFTKFPSSITGPNDSIIKPKSSDEVDYEVELVVVIGKKARNVSEAEALDYVLGYTVGNDVSARDWQLRKPSGQWSLGKSFDTFAPIGPSIVVNPTLANLHNDSSLRLDPNCLDISCKINGKVMQNCNTKEFIFNVQQVVSYLSHVFTLSPGDIIFTGTPSGVGFTRKPPIYLNDGDVVDCEIEYLGILSNNIKAEK